MILIIFTRYISYITRSIFLIFVCIKIIKKDTLNIFLLGFQHYQIGPNDMLVLRFSIEIHLENYYIIFLTYNYYILMLYILLMAHPSISTSNSSITQVEHQKNRESLILQNFSTVLSSENSDRPLLHSHQRRKIIRPRSRIKPPTP